ncbi:MAG: enoyl-CoA hydratase/isomerase family protein [Phenylobacterium sp.]|uniref:enoyl-CoA hydratase/isomerase n=1 Tax=Phenylobacterium sp. TaxID=1871053 RepID=UPI002606BE9C|nr:enoyl-CoA hydratase/isomerase [Phenylobacterium sp.]MDB5436968.1 enoyl-CoA hydratase/isomerase family protein [Phenylobacterium sp.]MDB5496152.1 enoyl-CoA hydratase/isomerase family protein [Phenylobacterium sp.]
MDGAATPAKVRTEVQGRIGIITLNDPATLNAAGVDLMDGLRSAFDAFVADPQVRAIVLTGEGRGFCSGANLSGGGRITDTPGGPNQSLLKVYNPFVSAVRKSPKPLVAAVNGVAAGVGASLALVCDLIVAGESAYFLQAFRRIGLVPDGGATYLLPRLVGKARAMELTLLGEKLPAATALEWGMINRCVPDAELMPTAMALATQLADGPISLGYTRNLIWASLDAAWHDQVEAEAYVQGDAGRTEDAREGIRAFVEKRPAQFKGR